jgi:hypothetical protein
MQNLSSARHYDQIRFRFHTAKTLIKTEMAPRARERDSSTVKGHAYETCERKFYNM